MYCDASGFDFVPRLERNWQAIRRELDPLLSSSFIAWPERALYGHGWDVFGLYAFGNKLQANCARCPETTRMVESIPGLRTAGFSMLQPGTHIRPHVGYSKAVLRCHLGLIVPGGCTMRVGAEIRTWEEGRCLIFDDTTEHEVWHRGSESRVVLLIDFIRARAPGSSRTPQLAT